MPIQIKEVTGKEDDLIYFSISALFAEMHAFMNTKDLVLELAPNGEKVWINSIKGTLGKLNVLFAASVHDEIIGFAAGNLRLTPQYLGSKKVGYISHLYVKEEFRKTQVGRNLAEKTLSWFEKRNAHHIELEVLEKNIGAIVFWEKMGFNVDNIRMYKKGIQ